MRSAYIVESVFALNQVALEGLNFAHLHARILRSQGYLNQSLQGILRIQSQSFGNTSKSAARKSVGRGWAVGTARVMEGLEVKETLSLPTDFLSFYISGCLRVINRAFYIVATIHRVAIHPICLLAQKKTIRTTV